MVLKLCSIDAIVKNAPFLLDTAQRWLGRAPITALLRYSFFAHFCAGEDAEKIRPTVRALSKAGIGSILDFAAEADDTAGDKAVDSSSEDSPFPPPLSSAVAKTDVARHYVFAGEGSCDAHVEVFERCIDAVSSTMTAQKQQQQQQQQQHQHQQDGFAAVKLTALGPPQLLKRMSTAIVESRNLFHAFDLDQSGDLTHDEFVVSWRKFFDDDGVFCSSASVAGGGSGRSASGDAEHLLELEAMMAALDPHQTGRINYVEWTTRLFRLENLSLLTARCRSKGPLSAAVLTDEELRAVEAMEGRIDRVSERRGGRRGGGIRREGGRKLIEIGSNIKNENEKRKQQQQQQLQLATRAAKKGVRLMIDAEQTYFQPAIDHTVYGLQERHNVGRHHHNGRPRCAIFGTHQCYLRDANERLAHDLARADALGYNFATK